MGEHKQNCKGPTTPTVRRVMWYLPFTLFQELNQTTEEINEVRKEKELAPLSIQECAIGLLSDAIQSWKIAYAQKEQEGRLVLLPGEVTTQKKDPSRVLAPEHLRASS